MFCYFQCHEWKVPKANFHLQYSFCSRPDNHPELEMVTGERLHGLLHGSPKYIMLVASLNESATILKPQRLKDQDGIFLLRYRKKQQDWTSHPLSHTGRLLQEQCKILLNCSREILWKAWRGFFMYISLYPCHRLSIGSDPWQCFACLDSLLSLASPTFFWSYWKGKQILSRDFFKCHTLKEN